MKLRNFATVLCLVLLVSASLAFGKPAATTSTVTFDANPTTQFASIYAHAVVEPSPDVNVGTVNLESYQDGSGNHLACGTAGGHYVSLASGSPGGDVKALGFTDLPGLYGYRAHYVPGNGGGGIWHESMSPCIDLIVNTSGGPCDTGFLIAATQSAGTNTPVAGVTWVGAFTITLSNCSPDTITNVHAQGGTSAWTHVVSNLADLGSVGVRKATGGGNKVLLWTIPSMAPSQIGNLVVNLSGLVKAGTPSGTMLNIDGAWSAGATDGGIGLTAGYTLPIIIQVF